MGFRMMMSSPYLAKKFNIWVNGTHKMYGYWPYEQISTSFDYLVEVAEKRVSKEERRTPKEWYELFTIQADPFYPVMMTKKEFETWIDLYVKDLVSTKHAAEVINSTIQDANYVKDIDLDGEVWLKWI